MARFVHCSLTCFQFYSPSVTWQNSHWNLFQSFPFSAARDSTTCYKFIRCEILYFWCHGHMGPTVSIHSQCEDGSSGHWHSNDIVWLLTVWLLTVWWLTIWWLTVWHWQCDCWQSDDWQSVMIDSLTLTVWLLTVWHWQYAIVDPLAHPLQAYMYSSSKSCFYNT